MQRYVPYTAEISIHALREEGDGPPSVFRGPLWDFYPRPPRGGRQQLNGQIVMAELISIHALREEGDSIGRSPAPNG